MTTEQTVIGLAHLVESVRVARNQYLGQKAKVDDLKNEFVASIQSEMDLVTEFQEQLGEAERQLRAAAIADHKATGNKHPHPAVTIRQAKDATTFEYDEDVALSYAIDKGIALALDRPRFEAYMVALGKTQTPPWFRMTVTRPEPTAAIAREIPAPEPKEEEHHDTAADTGASGDDLGLPDFDPKPV